MPVRDYRKGISDSKVPSPRYARTRLPEDLYQRFCADADFRRLTQSGLLRALVEHHYRRQPVPRVRAVGPSYAVARELNRIGVNLNQIAHIANATRRIPTYELQDVLERLEATLERL